MPKTHIDRLIYVSSFSEILRVVDSENALSQGTKGIHPFLLLYRGAYIYVLIPINQNPKVLSAILEEISQS